MTIDTGGAGRWRGQPGSLNVKKVLEPTVAMAWMVSATHRLRGLCDGEDGGPYANHFEVGTEREYQVGLSAHAQLPAGRCHCVPARWGCRFWSRAAARS